MLEIIFLTSIGMWLQDRGFTPNLEKLCHSLDEELHKLLEDLKIYLYKDTSVRTKDSLLFNLEEEDNTNQMYNDREEIKMFLMAVSEQNIQR